MSNRKPFYGYSSCPQTVLTDSSRPTVLCVILISGEHFGGVDGDGTSRHGCVCWLELKSGEGIPPVFKSGAAGPEMRDMMRKSVLIRAFPFTVVGE
jgi:hypothetical protein